MKKDLEARIAAAFADTARSFELPPLINEVEIAAGEAEVAAKAAKEATLDPRLVDDKLIAARKNTEEKIFIRDRLSAATLRLKAHVSELKLKEAATKLAEDHDAVLEKRGQLLAALEKNSAALMEVARIVAQIVECDHMAGMVNGRGGIGFIPPVLDGGSRFIQRLFQDVLVLDAFAAAAGRIPRAA